MDRIIWYSPIGFTGLARMQLSRSAVAVIVGTLVPPTIADVIAAGRFPA